MTRSGLQSLTVDRALSSSLLKRKTGWGFSSTQKEAYYRAEYRPSIGLKGDCSHEIKRRLLLGRQVMTNLDSILKSRNILPTKFRLVKAMVFPVVMYGCESWTIKKTEC